MHPSTILPRASCPILHPPTLQPGDLPQHDHDGPDNPIQSAKLEKDVSQNRPIEHSDVTKQTTDVDDC